MKVVKVRARFHWGFVLRQPLYTATQPSTKYPALTSIIGALSYGLTKLKALPETVVSASDIYSTSIEFLKLCSWITYSLELPSPIMGVFETRDINRILTVLGIRRQNIYPGSPYLWAIQSHGKIYLPGAPIEVSIFTDEEALDMVTKSAWLMVRLGSRESPISIDEVKMLNVKETTEKEVVTRFITPSELVKVIKGIYDEIDLPYPNIDWYNLTKIKDPRKYLRKFVIPREPIKVKVEQGSRVIVDDENDYYVIPVKTW